MVYSRCSLVDYSGMSTCTSPHMIYMNLWRGPARKGFDWDGVRRAFQYYEAFGLQPQGVCKNRRAGSSIAS